MSEKSVDAIITWVKMQHNVLEKQPKRPLDTPIAIEGIELLTLVREIERLREILRQVRREVHDLRELVLDSGIRTQ